MFDTLRRVNLQQASDLADSVPWGFRVTKNAAYSTLTLKDSYAPWQALCFPGTTFAPQGPCVPMRSSAGEEKEIKTPENNTFAIASLAVARLPSQNLLTTL